MPRITIALLALLLTSACDMPWDGPTTPTEAKQIGFTVLSEQGPGAPSANAVAAANSMAALRETVLRSARFGECHSYTSFHDPCWAGIPDVSGRLYVAVSNAVVCYRTVTQSAALSGTRLYFIYWLGKVQQSCNLMLAAPHWRLLTFNRADLPPPGSTLTVDLQFQDGGTTSDYTTEVTLT